MGKLKSKIDFKPTTIDAYDGRILYSGYLLDEVGLCAMPDPKFDFNKILREIKVKPKKTHLIFQKPKKK